MRRENRNNKNAKHSTFTSPRNLLAILRLSTALVIIALLYFMLCYNRQDYV